MTVSLDVATHDLITAVSAWTSTEFAGCTALLHRLSKINSYSPGDVPLLLQTVRLKLPLLPATMARDLFEALSKNLDQWLHCPRLVTEECGQLLSDLALNFVELLTGVCSLFVRIVLIQNITGNPLLTYTQCTKFMGTFMRQLFSALPAGIAESTVVECLIDRLPARRKPLTQIVFSTASLLHLLTSDIFLSTTSKCTLLRALCLLIIDLELNPESIETSDEQLTWPNMTGNASKVVDPVEGVLERAIKLEQTSVGTRSKTYLCSGLLLTNLRMLCHSVGGDEDSKDHLNWTFLCSLFKQMRELFRQHVLPVNASMLAFPLICIYTTSLRGGLMINWTDSLWQTVKDVQLDQSIRVGATSYLALLLSHTRACLLDLVVELLHDMTTWLVDYSARRRAALITSDTGTTRPVILGEHKVYFAVSDTVHYILTQLHGPLLDSAFYLDSCQYLPLAQIKLSPLNPWKGMPRRLRTAFTRIADTYNLPSIAFGPPSLECDGMETNMTCESLRAIQPSHLFKLPLNEVLEGTQSPWNSFTRDLWRDNQPGKRFTLPPPEPTLSKSGRKRKRQTCPTSLALNVEKLSRIVNGC